jgi:Leucine-rich repeat (LRR) protein
LPDGLTIIGDEAFRNCDLKEIIIEGNLESIGNYAFTDNYKLDNFNFGNALTSIGNYAFQNCYSLSSAKFDEWLSSIGDYAFYGCSSLESVNMPSTITSIGAYCFGGSNLSSIDLSRSQDLTIGQQAFSKNYKLAEIIFPEAITKVPQGLLWNCTSLTTVDLSQTNITEIGISALENCTSLTSIKLPKNGKLAKLCNYSLKGCTSLSEIDLTNTELATLDTDALRNCTALKTVKLPASLQTIGYNVFTGDLALRTIVVPCTTPPSASSSSFTNVATDECTIVIPSSAFYDYVLADNWSAFFNFDVKSDITIENPEEVTVTYATDDTRIELIKDAMVFLPNEQTVNIELTCTDGKAISKVLLDNNDVTDELVNDVLTLENFTDSSTIKIETTESTGVNNVSIDSGNSSALSRDVYNLQGIRVKANATNDDIRSLSPGIYVVGGKKVLVK